MSVPMIAPGQYLIPCTEVVDYIPVVLGYSAEQCNHASVAKKIYCTKNGKLLLATYFVNTEESIFELDRIDIIYENR